MKNNTDISIGLIGLGKMGSNLAINMKENGFNLIGYNRSKEKGQKLEEDGLNIAYSIDELINKLDDRKIIWLMVPQGNAVDENIKLLLPYLRPEDIIIDGGNSNYKESIRRYKELQKNGIRFIDVGTSGGINGARNGACMMIGGDYNIFECLKPIFEKICIKDGFQYMGKSGSGHFVKMIHNGIEYGMMQAIGEGFEILKESEFELEFDKIARVWNNGSIIEGYLMEMTEFAFKESKQLEGIDSIVDSSGEGLWTIEEALSLKVPAPIITMSLFERYRSQRKDSFSAKVVSAQRNQFGGHFVHKK